MTLMDINLSLFSVIWTVICIVIGFALGRKTQGADQSVVDALKGLSMQKPSAAPMVEEDPYFEAMNGYKQDRRIPTVDEGDR